MTNVLWSRSDKSQGLFTVCEAQLYKVHSCKRIRNSSECKYGCILCLIKMIVSVDNKYKDKTYTYTKDRENEMQERETF